MLGGGGINPAGPLLPGAAHVGSVGVDGAVLLDVANFPIPVSGPLTSAQLAAMIVAVSGNIDVLDRAARVLGVADVSDRVGRLLGVIASITAPVDVSDRAARALGLVTVNEQRASALWVTATGLVNAAVTLTLPAAGAGLFHYITSIEIVKLYSVVGVAAGAGVLITTTNLPGNPVWTTEQIASPAGTAVAVVRLTPVTPIKSAAANVATTIVAPVQLQTIWRINVTYFTAA